MELGNIYPFGSVVTITAGEKLYKRRFVGFDGNLCGAGAKAVGVTEREFDSGEDAAVIALGVLEVEAGGVITAGDPITSDSTGRAVKAADFDVSSEGETTVETEVETTIENEAETTVETEVTVSVPEGVTPVTSDAAQPDLSESATSTATTTVTSTGTSTATSTAESTITNSLSGGVLPVAINGYAMDAASGAGKFIRVRLN